MGMEKWRTVPRATSYELSNEGRIRRNGQIIYPYYNKVGQVGFISDADEGVKIYHKIGSLVCTLFRNDHQYKINDLPSPFMIRGNFLESYVVEKWKEFTTKHSIRWEGCNNENDCLSFADDFKRELFRDHPEILVEATKWKLKLDCWKEGRDIEGNLLRR